MWSNEVFPYLCQVMDAIKEAIETGRRGVVLMKSGQGGGTEGMINALLWLQTYYPGPMLYLISKDELAREFSRDRFEHALNTCPPVARKHLPGRAHGERIQAKRLTDGKLVIQGGQSVLNLQSQPYRVVMIDEVDSLLDEIQGHGDPIKLAEVRTDAWAEFGPTLIVAFAHPSTRDRGAGRLYYELSDQRRGFIQCPRCPSSFWLDPAFIRVIPHQGQSPAAAERDPSAYHLRTPCCDEDLTDAERFAACRRVEQRSTLAPEEAARRQWIGVHFSQLYMPGKTLEFLASKWIEGIDDEGAKRVVVNKRWGDVYEVAAGETSLEMWQGLRLGEGEGGAYAMGHVPEPVWLLTAGQDSRLDELHWAVWGWALVPASAGVELLCGWLVDCGVEAGPRAKDPLRDALDADDLAVLDQVLYRSFWPSADGAMQFPVERGLHDSGWMPIAVYEFCQRRRGRSYPSKGAAEDDRSRSPLWTWSAPPRWRDRHGREVSDQAMKRADLNTYQLKVELHGAARRTFETTGGARHARLHFPHDVPDTFLEHLASEKLGRDKTGRKKVWRRSGPNHWLDCTIMALAAARSLGPLLRPPRGKKPPGPPPPKRLDPHGRPFHVGLR